jgi:hypothetical protein
MPHAPSVPEAERRSLGAAAAAAADLSPSRATPLPHGGRLDGAATAPAPHGSKLARPVGRPAVALLAMLPLLTGSALAQDNTRSVTAGTGGVIQNFMVVEDSSNPTKFTMPPSLGGCGSGFTIAGASAGLAFPLSPGAGTIQTGVADNNVTAGDILVGGTGIYGRVQDAGTSSRGGIANTSRGRRRKGSTASASSRARCGLRTTRRATQTRHTSPTCSCL